MGRSQIWDIANPLSISIIVVIAAQAGGAGDLFIF